MVQQLGVLACLTRPFAVHDTAIVEAYILVTGCVGTSASTSIGRPLKPANVFGPEGGNKLLVRFV